MKVNIFDKYDDNTKTLIQSFETAEIKRKHLFVRYDGDLPENSLDPFTFFTEINDKTIDIEGKFFNQVTVPDFYDIRHIDGGSANIEYMGKIAGKIYYRKEGYRLVDRVDWLATENTNNIIKRDHYSRMGKHYASTFFSLNDPYKKEYYNTEGEVIISESLLHHTFQIHQGKIVRHFGNITQFFMYFLKKAKIQVSDIYINSLSIPLFISVALNIGAKTTLFWQEPLSETPPGNMVHELKNQTCLRQIIFMKETQLKQIKSSFPLTKISLNYLSNIGKFSRDNYFRNSALILTNSDNIYGLQDILENFPELVITVAAYTNMSTKLLNLGDKFDNLILIPSITDDELQNELQKADIYLDINHGIKVGNILKQAYQQHMIIFAYKEVAVSGEQNIIFDDIRSLCNHLSYIMTDRTNWQKLLIKTLEKDGHQSKINDYYSVLNMN